MLQVTYNADGFLEKNRDPLSGDLVDIVKASSVPTMAGLLQDNVVRSATGTTFIQATHTHTHTHTNILKT